MLLGLPSYLTRPVTDSRHHLHLHGVLQYPPHISHLIVYVRSLTCPRWEAVLLISWCSLPQQSRNQACICDSLILCLKREQINGSGSRWISAGTSDTEGARICSQAPFPLPPHTVQSIGNFFWNPCRLGAPCRLLTCPVASPS